MVSGKTFHYTLWGYFDVKHIFGDGWISAQEVLRYGIDGLFAGFMLFVFLGMAGLWSPSASIVLSLVGIIAGFSLGLLGISYGALLGLIVAGVILLIKLKV